MIVPDIAKLLLVFIFVLAVFFVITVKEIHHISQSYQIPTSHTNTSHAKFLSRYHGSWDSLATDGQTDSEAYTIGYRFYPSRKSIPMPMNFKNVKPYDETIKHVSLRRLMPFDVIPMNDFTWMFDRQAFQTVSWKDQKDLIQKQNTIILWEQHLWQSPGLKAVFPPEMWEDAKRGMCF